MTLCRPLRRVCWTAIVLLLSVIRGQKRTECQNYINSCRHLVYYSNPRFKIALVTDGRLSGASGKVPSAIHVTPEAYDGGLLAKVRDGDIIRVNGQTGELTLLVDEAELAARGTAHS